MRACQASHCSPPSSPAACKCKCTPNTANTLPRGGRITSTWGRSHLKKEKKGETCEFFQVGDPPSIWEFCFFPLQVFILFFRKKICPHPMRKLPRPTLTESERKHLRTLKLLQKYVEWFFQIYLRPCSSSSTLSIFTS